MKTPSTRALSILLVLLAGCPILFGFMDRCGHRELLLLFALYVALGVGYGGVSGPPEGRLQSPHHGDAAGAFRMMNPLIPGTSKC